MLPLQGERRSQGCCGNLDGDVVRACQGMPEAGFGSGRSAVASCREAVVCDGTVPLSAAALTSVKMEPAATGCSRIGRLRKGVNGSGERRS